MVSCLLSVVIFAPVIAEPEPRRSVSASQIDHDMSYDKAAVKKAINSIVNYEAPEKLASVLATHQAPSSSQLGNRLLKEYGGNNFQKNKGEDRREPPLPGYHDGPNSGNHYRGATSPSGKSPRSISQFTQISQKGISGIGSKSRGGVVFLKKPTDVKIQSAQDIRWQFSDDEKELSVELVFDKNHSEQLGPWPVSTALTALQYAAYEHPLVVTNYKGWTFNPTIAKNEALACRLYFVDQFAYNATFYIDMWEKRLRLPTMEKQYDSLQSFLSSINALHSSLILADQQELKNRVSQIIQHADFHSEFLKTIYPGLVDTLTDCNSKTAPFKECLQSKLGDPTILSFDPMTVLVDTDYALDAGLDALQLSPTIEIIVRLVNMEDSPTGEAYFLYPTKEEQDKLLDTIRKDYPIENVDDLIKDVETFVLASRFFSATLEGYFGETILPAFTELAARLAIYGKNLKAMPEEALEKANIPNGWLNYRRSCPPLIVPSVNTEQGQEITSFEKLPVEYVGTFRWEQETRPFSSKVEFNFDTQEKNEQGNLLLSGKGLYINAIGSNTPIVIKSVVVNPKNHEIEIWEEAPGMGDFITKEYYIGKISHDLKKIDAIWTTQNNNKGVLELRMKEK